MNQLTLTRLAKIAMMEAPYSNPNFPPSPYYRFLKNVAIEIDSRLSVELGVCGGGASLHMAIGSQKAVGVDIVNDYPDNIDHIKKYHPNFEFIIGDSIDTAPIIHNRFGRIDLLFIDTTHTHLQTVNEYAAYKPYLSNNAIICLDDLNRPGMDKAWDEMPEPKMKLDYLHPSQAPTDGGFGVIWK